MGCGKAERSEVLAALCFKGYLTEILVGRRRGSQRMHNRKKKSLRVSFDLACFSLRASASGECNARRVWCLASKKMNNWRGLKWK